MSPSSRTTILVTTIALVVAAATSAGAARRDNPGSAESVFRDAKSYTVRIRTRIETPFIEDEQGAFTGAGFLVDAARGWIVTNAHVVGRGPADVQVAFWDEAFEPVRKLYVDPFADIAVLALGHPVTGRPVARLDRADAPRVGEPVGAFGHPLGIPFTGTRGIVSGVTDVAGPSLIQIDATVDHGNSGGPVIALRDGSVLGIATAGAGHDKRDRMNFATPIADVRRILEILGSGGSPSPPRLGFALFKDEDGCFTLQVARSNDAERWPLEPGDRIVAVDGSGELHHLQDLVLALRGRTGTVALTVERQGSLIEIESHPALRPALVERRGLLVDGALFAPVEIDDDHGTAYEGRLLVHSVDPSSAAAVQGLETFDVLEAVDGRAFSSVEELGAYLAARQAGPLVVDLRRLSDDAHLMLEFHRRELPAADVAAVGPTPGQPVAGD